VDAAAALATPAPVARFVDGAPPEPESTDHKRIALIDLREFWKSPSRWFCRRVLNLAMSHDRDEAESEAICLDHLQKWRARDLALGGTGVELDSVHARTRLGLPAHDLMSLELSEIDFQLERVESKLGFPLADIVEERVEYSGDDFLIFGDLKRKPDGPMVEIVAASKVAEKYQVPALVSHVLGCSAGVSTESYFGPAGTPQGIKLWKPVDDAATVLATLVEGYRAGQRLPLRFFPRTSLAFAKALAKHDGAEPSWLFLRTSVQNEWARPAGDNGNSGAAGESFDEAVALCVRGIDEICNEEFRVWSARFAAWLGQVGRKS
jgi:exodeoxyribonuclease V gamma subunit